MNNILWKKRFTLLFNQYKELANTIDPFDEDTIKLIKQHNRDRKVFDYASLKEKVNN